jgi:signal transduction histidine kinase
MRGRVLLAVLAAGTVVNGLFLDFVPAWRQALFAALATAAYLHGRHLPGRRDWLVLTVVALAAGGYALSAPADALGALTVLAVFTVLPWLVGRFRRQQADLVRAGAERVARLEREREFVAERVRLVERARIAADMHDSLGHELALIALRAGALELAAGMTGPNRTAAAELRVSAVTATDRLRHTVGLLGTGPADPLDVLVRRAREAGMTVRLHRGDAPADPVVDRVVREALTNAARHAPGAAVDVRVEWSAGTLTVTVHNPVTGPPGRAGDGTGLAGLRAHLDLLGGTVRAGPDGDGFTVTASVPR